MAKSFFFVATHVKLLGILCLMLAAPKGIIMDGDMYTCAWYYDDYTKESPCVELKCLQDCSSLMMSTRARCLEKTAIANYVPTQDPTSNKESEDVEEPVGSPYLSQEGGPPDGNADSNENSGSSKPNEMGCCCYPAEKIQGTDMYTCSEAFDHYTNENPCTENKCTGDCINEGYSWGRCLQHNLIENFYRNQKGIIQARVDGSDEENENEGGENSNEEDANETGNDSNEKDGNEQDGEEPSKSSELDEKACCCNPEKAT